LKIIISKNTTLQDSASMPVAILLRAISGFSLLLLTIKSFDNSGSRKFIVCVDDARASAILTKNQLTVLDYERDDIVRGFGRNQEVSDEAISSAITYFEKHSVPNSQMRCSFKV